MNKSNTAMSIDYTKTGIFLLTILFFVLSCRTVEATSISAGVGDVAVSGVGDGSNASWTIGDGGNTGAFVYDFALNVPGGREKLQPNLQLSYSNQGANDFSEFGYGWNMNIPYIERLNKTGVENLYNEKYFHSSLSGELVQNQSADGYDAKVIHNNPMKYQFQNDQWIVTAADGATYTFGVTAASRLDDPTGNKVFKWMLTEHRDHNGNWIRYTYTKDSGYIYPNSIEYTGHGADAGLYKILFTKSSAGSAAVQYKMGFSSQKNSLISAVSVLVDETMVTQYVLSYTTGQTHTRDLLKTITEKTWNDDGELFTLPSTRFLYSQENDFIASNSQPFWSTDRSDFELYVPEKLYPVGNSGTSNFGTSLVDINGDGLTDVLRYNRYHDPDDRDPGEEDYDYTVKRVHLNQGAGNWDIDAAWDWDDVVIPTAMIHDGVIDTHNEATDLGTRFADVNGDGLIDLVKGYECGGNRCGHSSALKFGPSTRAVYLNTGSGWKLDTTWKLPVNFTVLVANSGDRWYFRYNSLLADINGDGLPDIVSAVWKDNGPNVAENVRSKVYVNNGAGWDLDASRSFPVPLNGTVDLGTRFGDFNGDGLLDVLRSFDVLGRSEPEFEDNSLYINTGVGWVKSDVPLPFSYVTQGVSGDLGIRFFDFNGDGLTDIIRSDDDGRTGGSRSPDKIWLSTGAGWDERNINGSTFGSFVIDSLRNGNIKDYAIRMVDFDGDGMLDKWNMSGAYSSQYAIGTSSVSINVRDVPDQLVEVTTSQGGIVSVGYDGFIATHFTEDIQDIGLAAGNPQVASLVELQSLNDSPVITEHEYSQAHIYHELNNILDRRFAGFGKVTKTTDLGTETTYYHQGNGDNLPMEAGDSEAKIGRPYLIETYE